MISFQRRYQENTKLLTVCKWIADLLIVILLAYTLTLFLCDRTTISGNSMQPAIENEDTVFFRISMKSETHGFYYSFQTSAGKFLHEYSNKNYV